jgi:transcriptional regulator with XRE-family HTH domain
MKLVVEIDLNEDYIVQLKRRMGEAGISQNALARELKLTASQVSRWFTHGERRVDMLVPTALMIERALLSIQRKMDRKQVRK